MIRMDEIVATLSVGKLRIDQEARTNGMRSSKRFGEADAQVLWDRLACYWPNV
jgi:hypothetical protein